MFIEENLGIGLMTDLTLFPEYPNLVKILLVEEEKTVFYISYAYPNEGEPQALYWTIREVWKIGKLV